METDSYLTNCFSFPGRISTNDILEVLRNLGFHIDRNVALSITNSKNLNKKGWRVQKIPIAPSASSFCLTPSEVEKPHDETSTRKKKIAGISGHEIGDMSPLIEMIGRKLGQACDAT